MTFANLRGLGLALAIAAATLLQLGVAGARAQDINVTIDNFTFTPDVLTVKPGTKVAFVNHDDIPHLVVAGHKEFRSKALDTNDEFDFIFETAGEFPYFCGLHPHMKGKIVVAP